MSQPPGSLPGDINSLAPTQPPLPPVVGGGIIRGDVRTVATQVTADSEFVITAPTYRLLIPGAAQFGAENPAQVDNAESVAAHTLSAQVAFTQGGPYLVMWRFMIGASVYGRVEPYFAGATDIYAQVVRLQNAERTNTIRPRDMDSFLVPYWNELLVQYPEIVAYDNLNVYDCLLIDKGLSYMTAAGGQMLANRPGVTGLMQQKQQGDTNYRFALMPGTALDFAGEAERAFNSVSVIRAANNALLNSFSPFEITGSTQDYPGMYRGNSLLAVAGNILSDTPFYLDASRLDSWGAGGGYWI